MHGSQIRQPTFTSRAINARPNTGFSDKSLQGSFPGNFEDPSVK